MEKFLIIIPKETDKRINRTVAQNIRKKLNIIILNLVEHLTVSIGTTIYIKKMNQQNQL